MGCKKSRVRISVVRPFMGLMERPQNINPSLRKRVITARIVIVQTAPLGRER